MDGGVFELPRNFLPRDRVVERLSSSSSSKATWTKRWRSVRFLMGSQLSAFFPPLLPSFFCPLPISLFIKINGTTAQRAKRVFPSHPAFYPFFFGFPSPCWLSVTGCRSLSINPCIPPLPRPGHPVSRLSPPVPGPAISLPPSSPRPLPHSTWPCSGTLSLSLSLSLDLIPHWHMWHKR